ncbi:hypothetical protein KSC_066160 [Ktedonobacter sp. SOSP1-52]|nr:hypothetical protein KSC_066160 [Ktedonobacter sp. SOSP1-52]
MSQEEKLNRIMLILCQVCLRLEAEDEAKELEEINNATKLREEGKNSD